MRVHLTDEKKMRLKKGWWLGLQTAEGSYTPYLSKRHLTVPTCRLRDRVLCRGCFQLLPCQVRRRPETFHSPFKIFSIIFKRRKEKKQRRCFDFKRKWKTRQIAQGKGPLVRSFLVLRQQGSSFPCSPITDTKEASTTSCFLLDSSSDITVSLPYC